MVVWYGLKQICNNRNWEIFKLPSISHRRKELRLPQPPQQQLQQQRPQQWNQQLILTLLIMIPGKNMMLIRKLRGALKTIIELRFQRLVTFLQVSYFIIFNLYGLCQLDRWAFLISIVYRHAEVNADWPKNMILLKNLSNHYEIWSKWGTH